MPLTVIAGALTKANWITPYLKPLVDATEVAADEAKAAAAAAQSTANAKYTQPAGGSPLNFLSQAARDGIVQTDGTVLRAVKLSQAQYDALTTKVATTLYLIVG